MIVCVVTTVWMLPISAPLFCGFTILFSCHHYRRCFFKCTILHNLTVIFSCASRLGSLVDWVKGHNITVVKLDCRIKVISTNNKYTELLKSKENFEGSRCKVIYDNRLPRIWLNIRVFPFILGNSYLYVTLYLICSLPNILICENFPFFNSV